MGATEAAGGKKGNVKAGRGQQKSGAGEASERARERGSAVSGREFARKAEPRKGFCNPRNSSKGARKKKMRCETGSGAAAIHLPVNGKDAPGRLKRKAVREIAHLAWGHLNRRPYLGSSGPDRTAKPS